jgi:hypothetical protein
MFTFKQKLLLAFGISWMIVPIISAIRYSPTPTTIEVIKEVKVPTEPKGVIVTVTIEDLYNDLSSRYPHISTTNKQLLMEAIAKSADKYSISPLVLYSLIAVESSFRWWIEHPKVTVQDTTTKKSVNTRAIGLGGIVYEIWGQELKDKGIIETKADLFSISHNIEAISYIYSKLKSQPLHPKASNQIESGLIRYFGGGYVSYFNKIDKEIARIIKGKVYK